MSGITATFESLRATGARALVPYFMAGDPSLEMTRELVIEADRRGADVIELGVPFSDPLADGPVIQRAGQRALAGGVSLVRVLEMVAKMRSTVRAPIVLFTYYNPVFAFGLAAFAQTAAQAGVDGVLIPDLPLEEAGELMPEAEASGLDVIHLVAPTTSPARARLIARASRGFIYLVSLTGVTGERRDLPPDLERQVRTLRLVTTKPICVGFGIGRPEQAAAVGRIADGVAVGSAIVRLVEEHAADSRLGERVGDFVAALKAPLRRGIEERPGSPGTLPSVGEIEERRGSPGTLPSVGECEGPSRGPSRQ
jgi:tryptophan synthase alpha chain